MLKRALSDEHQALLCLQLCSEVEEGSRKMAEHPSGLFTIAVCVMSNFSKSRILALQVRLGWIERGHFHSIVFFLFFSVLILLYAHYYVGFLLYTIDLVCTDHNS